MLPRLARAIESLFSGGLVSAAGFLRAVAQLALLAAVAVPLTRAALSFAAFRHAEPPRPRPIGHLWNTPTALYLSSGGRARRVSEAAGEVEAHLVDVRAPAFGLVWQGLTGVRAGPRFIRWRGRGGSVSRLLER